MPGHGSSRLGTGSRAQALGSGLAWSLPPALRPEASCFPTGLSRGLLLPGNRRGAGVVRPSAWQDGHLAVGPQEPAGHTATKQEASPHSAWNFLTGCSAAASSSRWVPRAPLGAWRSSEHLEHCRRLSKRPPETPGGRSCGCSPAAWGRACRLGNREQRFYPGIWRHQSESLPIAQITKDWIAVEGPAAAPGNRSRRTGSRPCGSAPVSVGEGQGGVHHACDTTARKRDVSGGTGVKFPCFSII